MQRRTQAKKEQERIKNVYRTAHSEGKKYKLWGTRAHKVVHFDLNSD